VEKKEKEGGGVRGGRGQGRNPGILSWGEGSDGNTRKRRGGKESQCVGSRNRKKPSVVDIRKNEKKKGKIRADSIRVVGGRGERK